MPYNGGMKEQHMIGTSDISGEVTPITILFAQKNRNARSLVTSAMAAIEADPDDVEDFDPQPALDILHGIYLAFLVDYPQDSD